MSPTAAQVLEQALTLEEEERATVASALFESLDPSVDLGAATAWEAEIQRRAQELDSGAVKPVPWSEVRRQLFDGFE